MHTEPPVPPPPPFALSTDLDPSCEQDVDLADDDQGEADELSADTVQEEVECVGTYPSIEAFLRAQLEDFVEPSCLWMLDCLDYDEVLKRFEGGRYRYILERGSIWRAGLPKQPCKDKDDSPPPWMPTRGG